MRALRRLGFKAKALIITSVFVLPLALVSNALWRAGQDIVDFAVKERERGTMVQVFAQFFNELTNARNATRAMLGGLYLQRGDANAVVGADMALAEIHQHLERTRDLLRLKPVFDKMRGAWTAAAKAPKRVDAQGRTVFGSVVESTRELRVRLRDDSNLVLDPEVNRFYLISAAVLTMPALMENTGQVWGWSSYAAAKGQLDKAQQAKLVARLAQAGTGTADLREYIGRALKATPDLKPRIDLAGLDKINRFPQLAQQAVLDSKEGPADKPYASGREALRQLDAVHDGVLPVIDDLLAAPVSAAQQSRQLFSLAVLACVALGGYLFYAVYLVTHRGLREVQKHLEAMTAGDLTTSPRPWGSDEAALLMLTIQDMRRALRSIVGQVRGASDAIVDASGEIAQASVDLSSRTEQAAANLKESALSTSSTASRSRPTSWR